MEFLYSCHVDPALHCVFESLGGPDHIIDLLHITLTKKENSPGIPDHTDISLLPALVTMLRALVQHNSALRHRLAGEKHIYYAVLRGTQSQNFVFVIKFEFVSCAVDVSHIVCEQNTKGNVPEDICQLQYWNVISRITNLQFPPQFPRGCSHSVIYRSNLSNHQLELSGRQVSLFHWQHCVWCVCCSESFTPRRPHWQAWSITTYGLPAVWRTSCCGHQVHTQTYLSSLILCSHCEMKKEKLKMYS